MGNFDVDLDFGQIYEEKIKNLFEGDGRIEVKTERDIWADTGNMAIEIRSRKKPSGISITEAKWWIHVFTIEGDVKFTLMFRVDKLKKAVKYLYANDLAQMVKGGDDKTSDIILAPISTLILLNKKF
jgi:hypothetical protein|tara:strand:+ start:362 stop:742 length:381 start_codon:yes stop_codon:yes gene_type:complete